MRSIDESTSGSSSSNTSAVAEGPPRRPVHRALRRRHEGEHALGVAAEAIEPGQRIAEPDQPFVGQVGPDRRQRHGDRPFGEPAEQRWRRRSADRRCRSSSRATVAAKRQRFQESGVTAGCGSPIYRPAAKRRHADGDPRSSNSCAAATISACWCTTTESGRTVLIDAPEEAPILAAIERTGWQPDAAADHPSPWRPCRGQPRAEAEIRPDDHRPEGGSGENPRHRRDGRRRRYDPVRRTRRSRSSRRRATPPAMSPIIFPERKSLFTADTLFALGCGRLFECKPPVMFESLKKLAALAARNQGLLRP